MGDVDNSQLPCGLNGALYFVAMENPIVRTGFQARLMPTRVLVTLVPAAMNSISGKPTRSQRCSRLTRATQSVRSVAKELLVGTTSPVKDMTVCVTRMDVTSTAGGWV